MNAWVIWQQRKTLLISLCAGYPVGFTLHASIHLHFASLHSRLNYEEYSWKRNEIHAVVKPEVVPDTPKSQNVQRVSYSAFCMKFRSPGPFKFHCMQIGRTKSLDPRRSGTNNSLYTEWFCIEYRSLMSKYYFITLLLSSSLDITHYEALLRQSTVQFLSN